MTATLEEMKDYLRQNNLTHLVRELVENGGCESAAAIEYVYDGRVLSKADFIAKYFG